MNNPELHYVIGIINAMVCLGFGYLSPTEFGFRFFIIFSIAWWVWAIINWRKCK